MTVSTPGRSGRSATWGWGIVAALCALLLVNAAWLFLSVGTPAWFEADTGVSASEFRAAYPGVADELAGRGRTIAVLLGALAALALAVSVAGMRSGSTWAAGALWVFVAGLLAVGLNALVGARADVGSFYLAWGVLAAVGLLLAGRGASAR